MKQSIWLTLLFATLSVVAIGFVVIDEAKIDHLKDQLGRPLEAQVEGYYLLVGKPNRPDLWNVWIGLDGYNKAYRIVTPACDDNTGTLTSGQVVKIDGGCTRIVRSADWTPSRAY